MKTCPDCKRPLPVDDAHRCPEDRGGYCWRTRSRSPEEETAHLIECLRAQVANTVRERDEVEHERTRHFTEKHKVIREHAARVTALTAERDEAREWVRRLTATERVLTCAFCGEAYPPGTPETNHERLTAHVKVCAKHPMREIERERDEALGEKAYGWPRLTEEQAEDAAEFFFEESEKDNSVVPGDNVYIFRVSVDGSMTLELRHDGTGRNRKMDLVRGGL